MSIESWGANHPVMLAIVIGIIIGNFVLNPFTNEIRKAYFAVPSGFRSLVRSFQQAEHKRLVLYLHDRQHALRILLVRCSVLLLEIFVIGLLGAC